MYKKEGCDFCKKYTKCPIHSKFPVCKHELSSMFIIIKRHGVWEFVTNRDYFCCMCRTLVMSVAGYKSDGITKAKRRRREENVKFRIEYEKNIRM